MKNDEPGLVTTEDQFHRRYWRYTNRPYGGCGCLWIALAAAVIYIIVSLIFTPLRFGFY